MIGKSTASGNERRPGSASGDNNNYQQKPDPTEATQKC